MLRNNRWLFRGLLLPSDGHGELEKFPENEDNPKAECGVFEGDSRHQDQGHEADEDHLDPVGEEDADYGTRRGTL